MKNYKLIEINSKQQLGTITIENDFNKMNIDILPDFKKDYEEVFQKLISSINQDMNSKVKIKNWIITEGSKDFWTALVQELFLGMGILVIQEKKD